MFKLDELRSKEFEKDHSLTGHLQTFCRVLWEDWELVCRLVGEQPWGGTVTKKEKKTIRASGRDVKLVLSPP